MQMRAPMPQQPMGQPLPAPAPVQPMPAQVNPGDVLRGRQDLMQNLLQQLRGGPRPAAPLPGGVRG